MSDYICASESVSAGHPDKICDAISDSIVDEAIRLYPRSRVAVETMATVNRIILAGEVTCPNKIDYQKIARRVVKDLGYCHKKFNFSDQSPVEVLIHQQSPDIALGVNSGGAGDQGIMFGYACKETPELMPLPIMLAHALMKKVDALKKNKLPYLRPDGKSEVTVKYHHDQPVAVEKVILAVPHDPAVSKEQVKNDLFRLAVKLVLSSYEQKIPDLDNLILNGTGRWEIGGPASDTGLTGRKIIVDSYGSAARVGGGCFSGKDPTKVDRSGAYAARFIAKNIVAAGLADKCEVQIAYVIGYPEPIAKKIETFGTAKKPLKIINELADRILDLSVEGIISRFRLRRPIYRPTAAYGHFGRSSFPWEKIVV